MHQREAHEEHQVATGGSVWSPPSFDYSEENLLDFGTY